jgi:hypothetical protein
MVKSKYLKTIILVAIILTVVIVLVESGSRSAPKLSEENAPYVLPETFEAFADRSGIYVIGSGQKDVLLVVDVFCSYSRKTYNLLMNRLEYIKRIRILLVSRFPENGSDVTAAFVMRMHALGEGRETLESAFKLEIPNEENQTAAQQKALDVLSSVTPEGFKLVDVESLRSEIVTVGDNTNLALSHDYTGTPHIIIGNRVLHGYTRKGIEILLKQGP